MTQHGVLQPTEARASNVGLPVWKKMDQSLQWVVGVWWRPERRPS